MNGAAAIVRELIPFSGLLFIAFAIKVLADVFIDRDHPAYDLKRQAVRFGQAFALIGAVTIWSAVAKPHHLPAGLLFTVVAVGGMAVGAIPVVATAIWKLRRVDP